MQADHVCTSIHRKKCIECHKSHKDATFDFIAGIVYYTVLQTRQLEEHLEQDIQRSQKRSTVKLQKYHWLNKIEQQTMSNIENVLTNKTIKWYRCGHKDCVGVVKNATDICLLCNTEVSPDLARQEIPNLLPFAVDITNLTQKNILYLQKLLCKCFNSLISNNFAMAPQLQQRIWQALKQYKKQ